MVDPHWSPQCTLISVKFIFVASGFTFVVVLSMDKDKSKGVN